MECTARRTRSRKNRSGATESELRGRGGGEDWRGSGRGGRAPGSRSMLGLDGGGDPASPPPPDFVIILDDDEKEGGRGGEEKNPSLDASEAMRYMGKRGSESPASSDRRALIISSDSESGSVQESGSRGGSTSVGERQARTSDREVEDQEVAAGEGEAQHSDGDDDVLEVNAREGTTPESRGGGGGEGEAQRGSSCVASRTRSQLGKQNRVYYTPYFKEEAESESGDEEDDELYQETENATSDTTDKTEMATKGRGEACGEEGESLPAPLKLKKRKISAIKIPMSGSNENNADDTGMDRQTRSHFNFKPSKKTQLGTVSNPYRPDQSDSSLASFSWEDDEGCAGDGAMGGDGVDQMDVREEEKGQEGPTEEKSNNRKRVQSPKADSLFKLLVDTILNDPKKLPEGLFTPEDETLPQNGNSTPCHEDLLPLVFSFGEEGPEPVKKSEQERELDELWADFDFATIGKNADTYHTEEGQTVDANVQEVGVDPSTPCSNGAHQYILDEQIGIACKFCSHVRQEIQDILPSWATRFGGKSVRKDAANEEASLTLDDLFTLAKNDGNQDPSSLSNGTVWSLIPGLEKAMYQHQREAFEFMWRNLAGGVHLDELKSRASSDGGGCVVSHAPGTGKTRLAIVFIQTYMKVFPECRPVIIAPCGILLTWEKEFEKWHVDLPIHVLNVEEYSGKEDGVICELVQREPRSTKWARIVKLYSWAKGSSILGLSYGLFKRLTNERLNGGLKSAEISKILLEMPGLFVLDEGHTPRNNQTLIWKALERVRTKQRIILSGTPFQNNFEELYNTLCLVRPEFSEKVPPKMLKQCQRKAEFLPDDARDIFRNRSEVKGKWTSRNNYISDDSLEELRSMIKPFVHVYNGKILEDLPGLRNCLLVLDPLPQQKCILEKLDDARSGGTFENEYKISLASVHPSLLTAAALSEKEKSLIDEHLLEKLRLDPNEGVKTRFVVELVQLSEALKEKVVVFSQYIQPLSMLRDQLIKQFNWTDGKEVLQMDGKIPSKLRQSSIEIFNNSASKARVLLASTKACCEGISLTGASRVVLLDIVWNPSVERQAISRAYRIGQEKVVYTYHLIAHGTSEGDKYEKQAMKTHLSKLVFSPEIGFNNIENISSEAEKDQLSQLVSQDKILEEMTSSDELREMFVKVYYPPKESNIMHAFG